MPRDPEPSSVIVESSGERYMLDFRCGQGRRSRRGRNTPESRLGQGMNRFARGGESFFLRIA